MGSKASNPQTECYQKNDFTIRNCELNGGGVREYQRTNENDQFNFVFSASWCLFLLFLSPETLLQFLCLCPKSSSLSRITSSRKSSLTTFPGLELANT